MATKIPHIPTHDDRERTTGHSFYYSREERFELPNAPLEKKKIGIKRFMILFLDIIILLVGVTVIRRCMIDRSANPTAGQGNTAKSAWINKLPYSARADFDNNATTNTCEYRLSVKRVDEALFAVDTNSMQVVLSFTEQGTNRQVPLRTLSPEAKLISHQFHVTFPKSRVQAFSAPRLLWRTGSGEPCEIPLPIADKKQQK